MLTFNSKISHKDVLENADKAKKNFSTLIIKIIENKIIPTPNNVTNVNILDEKDRIPSIANTKLSKNLNLEFPLFLSSLIYSIPLFD